MVCIYKFILFAYCQSISNYLSGFIFNNRKAFMLPVYFILQLIRNRTMILLSVHLVICTIYIF